MFRKCLIIAVCIALTVTVSAPGTLTSGGTTTDGRWKATTAGSITVDCTSGSITPGASPVFILDAQKADISPIKVQLAYSSTSTPPAQLQCSVDGSSTPVAC